MTEAKASGDIKSEADLKVIEAVWNAWKLTKQYADSIPKDTDRDVDNFLFNNGVGKLWKQIFWAPKSDALHEQIDTIQTLIAEFRVASFYSAVGKSLSYQIVDIKTLQDKGILTYVGG